MEWIQLINIFFYRYRWDISEVDRLPNYMKPIYTSLLDLFNEYEREINEQDRFNGVNYVKEAV